MRHDHSPPQAAPGLIRSFPRHIVEAILLKPCKTCLVCPVQRSEHDMPAPWSALWHELRQCQACSCTSWGRLAGFAPGLRLASYASALCCVRAEARTPVHALYHSISHSLSQSQYQISQMFCTVRVNCSNGSVSLDISGPVSQGISGPANVHTTVAAPGVVPVQRLRNSLRLLMFHCQRRRLHLLKCL